MLTTTLPGQISPDALDIPADCRQPRLDERRYLVGGELREWNGPTREVVSPLYVDGEPYVIGSCPALTEAESLRPWPPWNGPGTTAGASGPPCG